MPTKTTEELEKVLGNTHVNETSKYLTENADDLLNSDRPFADYMKKHRSLPAAVFLLCGGGDSFLALASCTKGNR